PQALGLCGEPSEARIELARQIERRLLACEPVCYLDLSRLDGGAILPDPRFDLPHGGSRGGHCLRRNQCSGQSCTLPLGFGSARAAGTRCNSCSSAPRELVSRCNSAAAVASAALRGGSAASAAS